jgi:CAAX protease family protein
MEPLLYDHLLATALIAVMPLWGLYEFRRLRRAMSEGRTEMRVKTYRSVLVQQWVLVIILALIWWQSGRSWPELGIAVGVSSTWRLGLGSAVVVALFVLLLLQQRRLDHDADERREFREQMEELQDMLPHEPHELAVFRGLSLTAGICEELLYRGFLLAYLGAWLSPWLAVPIAALIFGVGHIYQGPVGILKTGAVGLVMCLLYLLTGSLLHTMVLHAAIDWINGEMAYRSLQDLPDEAQDQPVS